MSACSCTPGGQCDCDPTRQAAPVADPAVFGHAALTREMLHALSRTRIAGRAPLAGLTTRDPSDPTIALIDAQAQGVASIAWNARRLWQDGTLAHSADRDALGAVARLLGYKPRPALSASTTLVFQVSEIEGTVDHAAIPENLPVASVPGDSETPVTFETDASLVAYRALNRLVPLRKTTVQDLRADAVEILLQGAVPQIQPGDTVTFAQQWPDMGKIGNVGWTVAQVADVVLPDPTETDGLTNLRLTGPREVGAPALAAPLPESGFLYVLGTRAAPFGATAPAYDLPQANDDKAEGSTKAVEDIAIVETEGPTPQYSTPILVRADWPGLRLQAPGAAHPAMDLDRTYDRITAGALVLMSVQQNGGAYEVLGRVEAVSERGRADFALSGRVSHLSLSGVDLEGAVIANAVRDTTIAVQTLAVPLYRPPKPVPVPDPGALADRIVVQGALEWLEPGRLFVLEGSEFRGDPDPVVEVARLRKAEVGVDQTTLIFEAPLVHVFSSEDLLIFGNCAPASAGATSLMPAEEIGRSNAANATPQFTLQAGPVANRPAPGVRGWTPVLDVRVGGRAYDEVARVWGNDPGTTTYELMAPKPGSNAAAEIRFAGRLPAGNQPVTARYRVGGGATGNQPAGVVRTIMSPVLGIASAHNPAAATGGMDPEGIDDIRRAAPASVRTLGRVVSRGDYEAFAASYRGVGKAMATRLRSGMREVICLTIATTELEPPVPGSALMTGLAAAVKDVSAPGQGVLVKGFELIHVEVSLALARDPALERDVVERAVRDHLVATFSADAVPFGKAIHRSEVLAAAQSVPGVVFVRLDRFARQGHARQAGQMIRADLPHYKKGVLLPASLLTLPAAHITLTQEQP